MKKQIVYLKAEKSVKVKEETVYLGDVFKVLCNNKTLGEKLKVVLIYKFSIKNNKNERTDTQKVNKKSQNDKRVVISLLKVIELIQKVDTDVEVVSLGENDVVVEYIGDKKDNNVVTIAKIAFVSLICFFGTAFTIMAFHNDIDVTGLFEEIYGLFGQNYQGGIGALEFGYSLGLGVGIIVFYNHLGKRRITKDPTPLEVEMRIYEDDVNQTLIDNAGREGIEVDIM
ncbi:MAG: stage V sporulation protein AA [Lachnospiraceae bacterium]|nr:stage V sporulation protein AA [Lachnospiraceae bacterium]